MDPWGRVVKNRSGGGRWPPCAAYGTHGGRTREVGGMFWVRAPARRRRDTNKVPPGTSVPAADAYARGATETGRDLLSQSVLRP